MKKLIFIDTETTGINREESGIWQIGGIIECGKRKEEFLFECDIFTHNDFDPIVTEVTGITLEKLSALPDPADIHVQFVKLLDKYVDRFDKKDKFTAINYGASFDEDMLVKWFKSNDDDYFHSWFWHPWTCVMNMAALSLQDERPQLRNFKMETVAEYLGIKFDSNKLHNALYDAQIAREIYLKFNKNNK
jgi:DNA polymerase III subunit epsilon